MEVPSPWVIVELLFFENLPDKQVIKAYCQQDDSCSLSEKKNDELLELEF
jgi:hypothetical protein